MRFPLLLGIAALIIIVPASVSAVESRSYGHGSFSISYPANYTLKEYKDMYDTVLGVTFESEQDALAAGAVELTVQPADLPHSAFTAEYAGMLVQRFCDADGPAGSITCDKVLYAEPAQFQELAGYRLLLNERRTDAEGRVTERVRGPVYVLRETLWDMAGSQMGIRELTIASYNTPETGPRRSHLRLLLRVLGRYIGD